MAAVLQADPSGLTLHRITVHLSQDKNVTVTGAYDANGLSVLRVAPVRDQHSNSYVTHIRQALRKQMMREYEEAKFLRDCFPTRASSLATRTIDCIGKANNKGFPIIITSETSRTHLIVGDTAFAKPMRYEGLSLKLGMVTDIS